MQPRHRQAVGIREGDKGLIILFRRPKPLRKLIRREIVTILGAGRITHPLQQAGQLFSMAQRQPDRQRQAIGGRQPARGLQRCHRRRDVTVQRLSLRRSGRRCAQEEQARHREPNRKAVAGHCSENLHLLHWLMPLGRVDRAGLVGCDLRRQVDGAGFESVHDVMAV